jgi:hypothetical protein
LVALSLIRSDGGWSKSRDGTGKTQALPGTALGGAASALQQDSREEQEEQQQQEEEEDTEPRTARRASSSAFSLAAASTAFLCLQWVRICRKRLFGAIYI